MRSDKSRGEVIRDMTNLIADHIELQIDRATRNCVNCMHFIEETEACGQTKPPQRPPAKVIVVGCELWEHDGTVPF